MNDKKFEQINKRLERLEAAVFGDNSRKDIKAKGAKERTLREVVKGRKFKNGQQQIAAIVGYHEKNLNVLIHKDKLKEEWINAKMLNKFDAKFVSRAKDDLIRIHPDGNCDLTQSGEEFFENFIKSE